jgi:archaeal type IV pilus assembly protein PilA
MVFEKDETAVSPVMGSILMVAVCVILAAVIAMYVFGVPSNVTKTKVVTATAQLGINGDILITYQGGQNDDTLSSLKITAPDESTWFTRSPDGALVPSSSSDPLGRPIIGSPMILTTPAGGWPPGPKHVMVVGAFSDEVSQVILDTYL